MVSPNIGSIDDLINETKKELDQRAVEKIDLDLEKIEEIWNEYKASVNSPSTKVTLENVKIEIVENGVKVVVPSSVSKEEIAREMDLYQKIRENFNNSDLSINLEIDRASFPELEETNSKKIYTLKEKYDHLIKQNPEMDYLVKTLKLKIEQE